MSRALAAAPVLTWRHGYRRGWLRHDLAAGLALSALLVPQGMAYAELAGLPPVNGLYTTVMALIGYALVGRSRMLVLGPDSSLGPMIAATLLPLMAVPADPARAVALSALLAGLVGILMIAAGALRLGFVADLLGKPTQIGYMNGLAVVIVVSQLPRLFGFRVDAQGVVAQTRAFAAGVGQGMTVPAALAVGAGSLAVIVLVQRLLPRAPAVLIAVVAATVVSTASGLTSHGVKAVGALPHTLPSVSLPTADAHDLLSLLGGAAAITFVALADTVATASAFARREGAHVDGNAEMVGIGTANVLAGLVRGFPVSTSASRTAVAVNAGARTQLAGLVGAAAIVILLVAAPQPLTDLPQPTLAAIVLAASGTVADPAGLRRLWRQRRAEAVLSIATSLGVILLGVLPGIALAVVLSILAVFRRSWWPYQAVLGKAAGVAGYHDVAQYPAARRLPGAVIFRFDAPLFFANARTFAEQVERLASAQPRPRWIIIAAEPITDVDTTAADMLEELDLALNAAGTSLVFAELKHHVRSRIERYGLTRTIDPAHFFPTITAAVGAYREEYGVDWVPTEPEPAGAEQSRAAIGGSAGRPARVRIDAGPLRGLRRRRRHRSAGGRAGHGRGWRDL